MVNDNANAFGVLLHISPHMFRHTFATELHNEEVDIRYIQQFPGHSSIATIRFIFISAQAKPVRYWSQSIREIKLICPLYYISIEKWKK